MGILNAVMVPHPPLIIPQVGRGEEKGISSTIEAYEKAAEFIADAKPDTIVIFSPHSVMYRDWFHISPGKSAFGDFGQYRAGDVKISVDYDTDFVKELSESAKRIGFPAGTEGERDASLDHATMIPLWFLNRAYGGAAFPKVVRIGLSGFPLSFHYRLGILIRDIAEKLDRRVSVVASGDLSHYLKEDGPYGFRTEGPQYDQRIMDVMGRGAFGELFRFSENFCSSAGECGHRSFTIMAGCLDGREVSARKLSYEGPFGVGYGVCLFTLGAENTERCFLEAEQKRVEEERSMRMEHEDEYVKLARLSVETYIQSGRRAGKPSGLSSELLDKRAGVFVSLHIDGVLRGCIGTTQATTDCVASEILQNGVSACSQDPRFSPVTLEELPMLEYSVDVLGPAQEISSSGELDVKRYGVIVSKGNRRGLLLPDLEGVDTVEEQISIAKKKAGIREHEEVKLERFEVVRHV